MFGAVIAGPFAHVFYTLINSIVPDVRGRRILEFLMERFTFAPCFCALSLFFLTIFEGKSVDQATQNLARMYKSVLIANWKYLTFPVFLNFNFVPPMLRVFVSNIIGFFWVIYLADKRRRAAAAAAKKDKSTWNVCRSRCVDSSWTVELSKFIYDEFNLLRYVKGWSELNIFKQNLPLKHDGIIYDSMENLLSEDFTFDVMHNS